jgi:hypothetical protein
MLCQRDEKLAEDDVANGPAQRIEEQVRSAFPEGAIERVQVLTYGDDPAVEPGETAIRVFISRAGRPEGEEADKEIVKAFQEASSAALRQLCDELPFIGWIDFRPDTRDESARRGGPFGTGPFFRFKGRGRGGAMPPDELSEQLTPVMTRLGAADLATVDTLIAAGIATSRAEILRWAVGRIRENPAYAQLQDRVHEINDIKTKF